MLPFELTKDTPYLALSGELWSVFFEYFNRNWSCYKGFLLNLHFLSFVIGDVACHLYCMFNIMIADGLATQGANASAAMVLTQ